MSIKTKILSIVLGLSLVVVLAPAAVGATTLTPAALTAILQAAGVDANTIAVIVGSLGGTSTPSTPGTVPAACASVTSFTTNLRVGSTGASVKCLQALLNTNSATQLATTGAASPGNETTYFGQLTLAGVHKFQTLNGITPASQVGPLTRAKLNVLLSGGTVILPPPTGPISAALAVGNPAAGALIDSEASADLLHVNFTGSGTITSVTLQRSGISDQNTLSNVYLYDGNTRITDGYSFNNNGQIVMNGLSIPVSGSHVISVRADVASDAINNSSSIAVTLTGFQANGTAVTANVMGNTFMIVTGTAATATLSANTVTGSPTVNAGTVQYTFWSTPVQVNTRAIMLKGASFKIIGSAPTDALANVKMFVDGVDTGKVATVTAANGSSYETYDFTSAPISLTTGSHTIDVRADIQKGTNRTVELSLAQASDLMLYDAQVGVNIAVGGTVPNNGGNIQINTGSVTFVVDPTFTSQTTVSGGAANTVIGRFIVHAYGEDVKISTLQVNPEIDGATTTGSTCTTNSSTGVVDTGKTCGLNNVTLYFNGSQIGSQKTWTQVAAASVGNSTTAGELPVYTLGSQMIAPAGQDSTLEVRADLQTTGNIAYTGGTVKVTIPFKSTATTVNYLNATGQSSQSSVSVPPAGVATTGLSIGTGGLQVAANSGYVTGQKISPNTTGVRIGSYIVQNQSTSESVRLTSLALTEANTGTLGINDLSALYIQDSTGGIKTSAIQPSAADTFSVNETLAPGASTIIDVFANTGSDQSGNVSTTLNVYSIGVVDNLATNSTAKTGQTLALGTGSIDATTGITLITSPTSTTPAEYVAGGSGSASTAQFNFVATNATATVSELKFVVSDTASNASVTNVCIGSICAQPVSGIADLTGLNLSVPTGGGSTPTVQVSYSPVGLSGITPGTISHVTLVYVKYTAGGSTGTLCSTAYPSACTGGTSFTAISAPSSTTYVTLLSSVPSVSVAATTGATLNTTISGVTDAGRVTVTAGSQGAVRLRQITFNVGFGGYSAAPTLTTGSSTSYLAIGNTSLGYCSVSGTTVTCDIGGSSAYGTDFIIGANTSTTFDLFTGLSAAGTPGTGTLTENVSLKASSSASDTAAFRFDDTSTTGGTGYGPYNDYYIYNFPTGSTSVHN